MDFSQVKAITIPEGNVTRILSGTTVLWEKMGGLPSAYQQVEYIESDGSQYIDTGVIGKTGLHIVTEMGYATLTSTTALFGSRDPRFFVTLYPSTIIDIGYNGDNQTGINAESRKIYNIDFDTSTSPARFGIDGSYITSNNQVDTNRNIYIFGCNRNGAVAALSKSIFKSMTITDENGGLLRKFVPCYRKSDGVAGLYDMVNNVFYTNAGTGEFTVGPKVFPLPSEYQQVEYIESSGTQYIATNYTPTITENMKIEIDYMFTRNQDGDSFLFGSKLNNPNAPTSQCEYYSHRNWYCGSGIWQFRSVLGGIGGNLNTRYSLVMDGNVLAVGDFTQTSTDTRRNGNAAPMYIFAGNWIGRVQYINKGARIYSLAFTADGIKEAEFVPCYRKSDGEIGMYDLVSTTFFTNSGSGTFSKGADVT